MSAGVMAQRIEAACIAVGLAPYAPTPPRIRVKDIENAVLDHFGMTPLQLRQRRRTQSVVRPRQIVMHLARDLTPLSYQQIGYQLSDMDASTIAHGAALIDELCRRDPAMAADVAAIRAALGAPAEA